ncbi:MAG: hypothetical protein IJ831_04020 [Spirochaetales bacterium]|nr:hypothetical protein [Spirochaetales bacterium]
MRLERIGNGPIISQKMSSSIGNNLNGATLIRVPDWIENPLGRYYIYFAHHRGRFIRLAYSDRVTGPWKIYEPGVLHVEDYDFLSHVEEGGVGHVASPDIFIDEKEKRLVMYFHSVKAGGTMKDQATYAAVSSDGLDFTAYPDIIGNFYFRSFLYGDWYYAFSTPAPRAGIGICTYRSKDLLSGWERGNDLFPDLDVRHSAVKVEKDRLVVLMSLRGAAPESILGAYVDLSGGWNNWKESRPEILLQPEREWEGANLEITASKFGPADPFERHLRDPYIYSEEGNDYVLYSAAGEHSIALATLF